MILENSEDMIGTINIMEESIKKAIDGLPLIGSYAWVRLGEAYFHLHEANQLIQAVTEDSLAFLITKRKKEVNE